MYLYQILSTDTSNHPLNCIHYVAPIWEAPRYRHFYDAGLALYSMSPYDDKLNSHSWKNIMLF